MESPAEEVTDGWAVRPLTAEAWPNLLTLFGPSGGYSNCWCTWWRQGSAEFSAGLLDHGAGNRALLERLAAGTTAPGLIGYRDGEPVGWVSVGPRPDFPRLLRSRVSGPREADAPTDPSIWSVVCFYIPRQFRGSGVGTALLAAAVEHARAARATAVEGYPTDTGGGRHPSANLFTGTLGQFTAAGFVEVERRSPARPIVRRTL